MNSFLKIRSVILFFVLVFAVPPGVAADDDTSSSTRYPPPNADDGIRWKPLLLQSAFFLSIQHGFRFSTEDFTRELLGGKFFRDYGAAIGNLHGWGDGDNFLVNYVGHPMQGAVAGYIFVQNDPKYIQAEFGKNRQYWKSRLRATAFSFAYSEQFEIGPISEASLANTQAYYPQQGLVDKVITPVMGMVWMIGEDAIDRMIIQRIEAHTKNPYLKLLVRGGLNPSRSMANAMRLQVPWQRDTRPGVFKNRSLQATAKDRDKVGTNNANLVANEESVGIGGSRSSDEVRREIPIFELSATYNYTQLALGKPGSLACHGGGSTAAFNLNRWVSLVADVGGCNMRSPGVNISGDSTHYLAGPRFTFRNSTSWIPYIQFLAGGNKLTAETFYPELKPPNTEDLDRLQIPVVRSRYTSQDQINTFAIQFGGGADYVVNNVLAVKVFEVQNLHTWARQLNERFYPNNLRFSTGVVLRFGNW